MSAGAAAADPPRRPMKKCRITVLETTFNEKLAKEYGAPGIGRCPFHKPGQTFVADFGKPDGLCDEAWLCMKHYVFALSLGVEGFWSQWIPRAGVSINTCNDGLRPVVFKIEQIEG